MEAPARTGTEAAGARPPLRFGDVAVHLGYVSRAQVDEALRLQARDEEAGRPRRLLGEILRDEGWLTFDECRQVTEELVAFVRNG